MPVIAIEGLSKIYDRFRRRQVAVDGLTLEVPEGGVFGFLGPNGSGKTTTIRCILGLVRPTSGESYLLGARSDRLRPVIERVGSIVETPTFFPTFTGLENLRLLASLHGLGRSSVDTALERVGLADRAHTLVRKYSLGMKQRLGLAAAILRDPEVLILDEPANGLDPAGIRDVRNLIRSLADDGRTVFLSSHILSEVEQVCDHVAILSKGRCIASGPVHDVLQAKVAEFLVRARDPGAAMRALDAAGFPVRAEADGAVLVSASPDRAEEISGALFQAGVLPTELRAVQVSLEDVFLELTTEDV